MLLTGVQKIVFYYDGRFAIPAKLMFWGNILFPAITLLWSGFWLIRKRKTGVSTLLPGLLVCTVLNTVMAASVPALTSRYYLALGAGAINQYLLFLLIDLLFFICCVIYLSSSFIVAWKAKAPEHRYKGEKSVLFWADYIQTEYYQQDYDADLCNLSACNFYVYCSPHSGGMGFRLS